jgi:hypothetical protein
VPKENRTRWRWLPIGAAALVWLGLLAITLMPEWRAAARARLPWMMEPLFHDWHVVRLGWEAHAAGGDPLADKNDPFNYPRFVLLAAPARIVPPAAGALVGAAIFLGALVWALRPRTRGQALLSVALVASPPVLLLLERGNLDAWAFALVVAGLGGLVAAPRLAPMGGLAALLGAALIKFHPAVLLPAAVAAARGPARWCALATAALFAAWLALHLEDVALVMQKTTRGLEPAYGRMVAGARWHTEMQAARGAGSLSLGALMHASLVACIALLAAGAGLGWRWRARFGAVASAPRERAFGWGGALIYAGTFFLGNNWSYRLVFLALMAPFLWRAAATPGLRAWGTGGLVGLAALMLAPFHLPLGLALARETVAWTMVPMAMVGAVGLLTSAPPPHSHSIVAGGLELTS